MSMKYVRDYYGVPAKRGGRVTVDGKPGVICSANKSYLMVRFDGDKYPLKCHPTWRVSYPEPPNTASTGQERDSANEPGLSNSTHVPAQGA